jgi:two-component system, NtrC family, sensor kinase
MKKTLLFFAFVFLSITNRAQGNRHDSLIKGLIAINNDRIRMEYNDAMMLTYAWTNPDSAIPYAQQNLILARKIKSDSALSLSLGIYGYILQLKGNFPQALYYCFEALKVAEQTKDFILIASAYHNLNTAYLELGDYTRALLYAARAKSVLDAHFTFSSASAKKSDTLETYINIISKLAVAHEKNNQLDSALKYIQITEQLYKFQNNGKMDWDHVPLVYGNIYLKKGNYQQAIQYYRWGIELAARGNYYKAIMEHCYGLAVAFKKLNKPDSSIYYANRVLEAGKYAKYPQLQMEALTLLANLYKEKHNTDSTAKYFELASAIKDSLFNQDKVLQMQNQTFNEQVRQQEIQEAEQKRLYQYRLYSLLSGLLVLAVVAFLLYRNNQHKQKSKVKIEEAYEKLKLTQAQLIQSEKMASLGELTAGIAHEIQNPLNFVNNFSEVNTELIEEAGQEINKGNIKEVKIILNDIKENEQKINHHGKRADAIVKGMLQHSQKSTGQKEPTDINKLADEYLRLSYQGLRAKDKTFNATLKTDFDETIGKINIIPQDIGRVLLNLYNNAFYAISPPTPQGGIRNPSTQNNPTVWVSTRKQGDKVLISVKDNGNGIPQKIVDKIFQPFFTTKPTGQGTGLGLSLSYDIVKAHGGEIKVETKEGEGSEFMIQIPA